MFMLLFAGVPRGGTSKDSGVVDDGIFGYFGGTPSESRRPALLYSDKKSLAGL